jgi:large repetitive protein
MQSHFIPFTIEYTLQHKQGSKFYLNIESNRVVQPQIDLGLGGARGIALDPVNNKMYVTNFNLNTVAIIYMNTNTVVGSPINVGVSPHAIAFDSEHHRIHMTHINNHTVTVIHTNTHQ